MYRLTVKNLWANKLRFALTTFGVTLAVSFVVAAFVLGDGLRATFTDVSKDVTAGVDLQVRNVADFGDPPPLAADTVSAVSAVDGVADAVASIEAAENAVRPLKANGDIIPTDGPPQLAFNWIDNPELSPFTIVDGEPPGIGQFTMDVDAAANYGFTIGRSYTLLVPDGRVDLTLSGTSSFGADNATLGAVLMQMNSAEASQIFGIDGVTNIAVQVADGADIAAVRAAVAAAVPTAEVVDHATVLAEKTAAFTEQIDLVGNILLGFGGVALLVSMFIIYNTFAIVFSQRARELALLRTVGADPKQIRRSVLIEALIIGMLASAGGIGGGIAVAKALDALFAATGSDLSDWPMILAARTVIAAIVIGIGVTVLAALAPARRAANVPPIAVLSGTTETVSGSSRSRTIIGVALFGGGSLAGVVGLTGAGSTAATVAAVAGGAVAMFVAVALLAPLAVGGVTRLFGWPMRKAAGVAGGLAQRNAARNSHRTATTAAALMIGLTLVTTALMVGASAKATIGSTFGQRAKADYYLSDDLDEVNFPPKLAEEIRRSDVVSAATGLTRFQARVDGAVKDVAGIDFDQVAGVVDLDIRAGGFDTDVANPVVVFADEARSIDAHVGDTITIDTADTTRVIATIVGLFNSQAIVTENYVFDTSVLANAGIEQAPEWLAVSIADGAPPTEVDALVRRLSTEFPSASVETSTEFRKRLAGDVDNVLAVVNVLVALAVIIALIGIANTLALSVFERTRELGLVRAVGMTRRQLRRMVTFEAALVAIFGATLGVGLGLLFGFGVTTALPDSFVSEVSVPISQIAVLMLVAALAGVFAAWLPARRAGRLDVLGAIAL